MKKIGGDIYTGEFGGDGEAVVNFFFNFAHLYLYL